MRIHGVVATFAGVMLVYMLVCPAIHACMITRPEEKCHEEQLPQDQKDTGMEACCDQTAVSVQQFHWQPTTSTGPLNAAWLTISPTHLEYASAFTSEPPPVRDDYLSSLCVLRI